MSMDEIKTRDGDKTVVYVVIEGLGEFDEAGEDESGLWFLGYGYPSNAANVGAGIWKLGLLNEVPNSWTAAYSPLGGAPTAASGHNLRLSLQPALLAKLAFGQPAVCVLASAITQASTSFDVTGTPPAVDSVIYVDREAMFVTNVAGQTLTVQRSRLMTRATTHGFGAQVLASNPTMIGRRIKVFAVSSTRTADRVQIGPDALIKRWLFQGTGAEIEIESVSYDRVFARQSPAAIRQVIATDKSNQFALDGDTIPWILGASGFADDNSRLFLAKGATILELPGPGFSGGVLSSYQDSFMIDGAMTDIDQGDRLTQVFLANRDFRWNADDTETARDIGTWTPVDNAFDILLCLLTSASSLDQDWVSTNQGTGYGNWACLPSGAGYGVSASDIDFGSFVAAKRAFPDYRFPGFIWGLERKRLADVANELLRPLRGYLIWGYDTTDQRYKLRCNVPRMPTLTETVRAVDGPNDVLGEKRSSDSWVPDLEISSDPASTAGRVVLTIPSFGRRPEIQVVANDNTIGSRSAYEEIAEVAESEIEVTFPKLRGTVAGIKAQASELALRLLRVRRSGATLAQFAATLALADVPPGGYLSFTLGTVPDLESGTRGLDARMMQVRRSDVSLDPPRVKIEANVYGDRDRLALIAPSAKITGVVDNTTYWTLSINPLTYTVADPSSGLPQSDTAAFRVGQNVALCDATGAITQADFGSVQAIPSSSTIEILKGTGTPASTDVLTLATWDATPEPPEDDRGIESYFADATDLQLPDGVASFVYGD